jgi:hypothetical protein
LTPSLMALWDFHEYDDFERQRKKSEALLSVFVNSPEVTSPPVIGSGSQLALADGGSILATNHVPNVPAEAWHEALQRCATKAGRPLRALEAIAVDSDFPSFDGQPPLKVALASL